MDEPRIVAPEGARAPALPAPGLPAPSLSMPPRGEPFAPPADPVTPLVGPGPSLPGTPAPRPTLDPPPPPVLGGPPVPPAPSLPDHADVPVPATTTMQPTSAVPDAVDTPDEPATRRSPMRFIVPLGFVAAFAALGFIGYKQMTASDDEAVAGRAPATTVAAEAPPLVAPIDDAQDVVDEINDNTGEDELVDDLDVDDVQAADRSIGATIEFRPGDLVDDDHISAAESAAFSYSYQRGEAPGEQVWVDAATTNRESFDGTTWRRTVDGTHYATEDPAGVWALAPTPPADSLASLPSMLTLPDVLPEGLIEAIGASMGDGIDGRYIIADTDFAAAPEARAAWLVFWGFDPTSPVVEAAGFVDAVPDAASAGQILISVRASSDGIVTRVYIDAPSFGTSIGYSLVGVSSEALVVPAPDVGG